MADAWYYKVRGQQLGPVPFDDISGMAQSGRLAPSDEIRFGDAADWMPAESVVGLFPESGDPEELSNLDDLDFSFEDSEPAPARTRQSAESSVRTIDEVSDLSDLDDLDINIVSEGRRPETTRQASPAIDPSVGSAPAEAGADDVEESWYYQSLGQELGPMPFEELRHLAESGALISSDLIRQGTLEDWSSASTNSELSALLEPVEIPDAPAESKSPPRKQGSRSKKKKTEIKRKPAPEAPPDDDIIDDEPEGESDIDDVPAEEPARPAERWFCRIDGVEHGPLEFEDLKSMATHQRLSRDDQVKRNDDGQWKAATTVTGLFASASPIAASAFAPGGASSPIPGAAPQKPRPSKAAKTKTPKTKRVKAAREPFFANLGDKLPLLIGLGVIGSLIGIVLVIGLFFTGAEAREYHTALNEIYEEHRALREKKAPDKEWQSLTQRANTLKETIVPIYKDSRNRAEKSLLFAVRDWMPQMLKDSHKKSSSNEAEFKRNLDDAGRILGVSN